MILDQIIQNSRRELIARQRETPLEIIQEAALRQTQPVDLAGALQGQRTAIIAEIKKASPSQGVICEDFDPVGTARTYAQNGAAAISVLTETRYFQGSPEYLREINRALGPHRPPLLRKDFIFDPYQVYESRACGADALLLITAILGPKVLTSLLNLSHQLGMRCLVEVHNRRELNIAIKSGAEIIGINNRDLNTFAVDIATTGRLRPHIPPDRVVVSESGIKTAGDMEKLRVWGVNAALVGESLMASPNIADKMRELQNDTD
jgi:indole-3-glycerol phosphate synthase